MINADMIICDGGNQIKRYWSTNYVKPSNGVIVSGASCSQSFDFQSNRLILESWKHKKEPQQKKRRREDDMYMYDKLPGTYNLEMIDKMDMKHVSGIIAYIVSSTELEFDLNIHTDVNSYRLLFTQMEIFEIKMVELG